ncbi:divalent-cation tolerance protein CutA, partial [Acinetobacter baumannii]|uniref:divalent-cation tolerance protein CutA n=3 Tax=Pseudomonadota TaxID=1224 RepID=UPI000A445EC6
ELQGDEEITLTFKTTVARLPELAVRLREQHPYELPELIVLPVVGGFTAYLDWVRTQTRPA